MNQHNEQTVGPATGTQLHLSFVDRSVTAHLRPPARDESATSKAAARSIESGAPTLRARTYEAIRRAGHSGLTRPEIA
ncbi:MAG TPA: hypothetical protein P5307_29430, partial [Pirellulaceae bacterium]|nr:hypothetical protein [Pirellulaceae bacterium]